MTKFLALFLFILTLVAPARAASLERDLGHGLAYHRIHQLPADLPPADPARRQPCVLDLRYVHPDADAIPSAGQTLTAWLKFHATPRAPVFILANADTSAALLAPLTGHDASGSVVVIGPAAPGFAPDIAVRLSPG